MGTTPNRGFPYPEGTDYVASGDDAIEALALAVDTALTTRMWASAYGDGEAVTADLDWAVDFDVMDAGPGFTAVPDGGVSPKYIYTGPTGRWFILSTGVSVAGSGSSSITLRLVANGNVLATATTGADSDHLTISVPVALTNATEVHAYLHVAGAAGSYADSWLRAVSL